MYFSSQIVDASVGSCFQHFPDCVIEHLCLFVDGLTVGSVLCVRFPSSGAVAEGVPWIPTRVGGKLD